MPAVTKTDDTHEKAATSSDATAIATTQTAPPPSKVPLRMGVAPTTLEEAWRMAGFMAQSELVPKQYRAKPADVLVAIQYGMELGFPPMQALQSIAVINGRPSVWGDGFLALIMASPLYQNHDEYFEVGGQRRDAVLPEDLKKDDTAAVCTFWRRGKPQPVTRRFSVGQAKKASLLGKEGPWQTYPDRQMQMRARGFAGRDAFADILRGVKTAEEVRDIPDGDLVSDLPAPQPQQPRRASEGRPIEEPTAAAAASEPRSTAATEPAKADRVEEILRGLKVTNTCFVRPKAGEPFYQLTMKTTTGGERVFVTRDEAVYKEAASFEGTDHLVVVGFHHATTREDKAKPVLVLDRLSIYEPGSEASSGPEPSVADLFES